MQRHVPVLLFAVLTAALLSLGTCPLQAAEPSWPQQLGPNRNGISNETGLLESWPAAGPKAVWRAEGGVGMSGLAVEGKRLFTMVQRDAEQQVVALDRTSGESLWATQVAPAFKNSMGNGPRATPTVHGDKVFTFSGEGILTCLSAATGKIAFSHNVVADQGGKTADYGMACSPLVVGDKVVVTAGAPGACLVAYNIADGKLAWKQGDDRAGYSSPALRKVGGRQQLVAFTGSAAVGLDPDTGGLLWRYGWVTDYDCNIATPLAYQGQVFLSSGENHGSALLKLEPSGDAFEPVAVWTSLGPKSVMRNEWQTSILIDGKLYGFDNVGSAGPVTHLNCVDIKSGERLWQKLRFGKGNLIAADGKLFISTFKGELVVVRVNPERFEELGRAQMLGSTRQAPALAAGLLYLRDGKEIVCLDVRK